MRWFDSGSEGARARAAHHREQGHRGKRLLAEHRLSRALFAGDDTTDIDGFRALDGLELAVRIAVASPEGPEELRIAADLVVTRPEELLEVLRKL